MQATLRNHPLFAGLAEEDFATAAALLEATPERFRRGELLVRAGEPFLRFGILLSGAVQVYTDDIDGERMMMANVGAGDSFGESLAYFETRESPVYVLAAEDTEVVFLSAAALKRTLRSLSPSPVAATLSERFTSLLAARALSQNDRIQILSKATIRERLVTFFTQWEHRERSRTFRIPFDRAALADYLGVNRSALSRELSKMKEEGIIDFFRSSFRLLQ